MAIKHFLILYMDFGEKARRYRQNLRKSIFRADGRQALGSARQPERLISVTRIGKDSHFGLCSKERVFFIIEIRDQDDGAAKKGKGWVL